MNDEHPLSLKTLYLLPVIAIFNLHFNFNFLVFLFCKYVFQSAHSSVSTVRKRDNYQCACLVHTSAGHVSWSVSRLLSQ